MILTAYVYACRHIYPEKGIRQYEVVYLKPYILKMKMPLGSLVHAPTAYAVNQKSSYM
jgi:hypothetical protein